MKFCIFLAINMFSNFSFSFKWKTDLCDHTDLRNFVLGIYILVVVYYVGNCFSSEHYAWIICLLFLFTGSAEHQFYSLNHTAPDVLHFSSYWKGWRTCKLGGVYEVVLNIKDIYLFCKPTLKANNSDNSAKEYHQVSNTFFVLMH